MKNFDNWDLRTDRALVQAIRYARLPLCISDPHSSDNPIVFANEAFCDLTGYAMEEVIGRNCRFLQGPETSDRSIEEIRRVMRERATETIEIVNYKKNGESFINSVQIGPIHDENGELVFFFGSQLDITEKMQVLEDARKLANSELVHRMRNLVNVMAVIVRLTSAEKTDIRDFSGVVINRLITLSDAHFDHLVGETGHAPGIRELAEPIVAAYSPLGERQFTLTGSNDTLPERLRSPIALILHELATNAAKHGAFGVPDGHIDISWEGRSLESGPGAVLSLQWRESNGPKVTKPKRESGSKIIVALARAEDGVLDYEWHEEGLRVRAEFPIFK